MLKGRERRGERLKLVVDPLFDIFKEPIMDILTQVGYDFDKYQELKVDKFEFFIHNNLMTTHPRIVSARVRLEDGRSYEWIKIGDREPFVEELQNY